MTCDHLRLSPHAGPMREVEEVREEALEVFDLIKRDDDAALLTSGTIHCQPRLLLCLKDADMFIKAREGEDAPIA